MTSMTISIVLCNELIRDLDFSRQCGLARSLGYDGLEIAPFTLGPEPHRLTGAEIAQFRTIADGEGIAITGLHWLLAAPDGLSITTTDEAAFGRTVEFGQRLVDLCQGLGGGYLVHGSPAQRRLEAGAELAGRHNGIRYFAAMAEAATAAELTYYIEPLSRQDTSFVNSIGEALDIIGAIGSPRLATMLDCYAAHSNGEDAAALLGRHLPDRTIGHVHFNDPNKGGPGDGELDFKPIIDVLYALDYSGSIAIEPFIYEPDGPTCAARAITYTRGLLEARRAGVQIETAGAP